MISTENNDRSKNYYTALVASSTQTTIEPQTIPKGESWEITEVVTSVPTDELSYAAIYFGSDLIFSAYSDRNIKLNKTLIGDDVKQLYCELKNAQLIEMPMGIKYAARKIDS